MSHLYSTNDYDDFDSLLNSIVKDEKKPVTQSFDTTFKIVQKTVTKTLNQQIKAPSNIHIEIDNRGLDGDFKYMFNKIIDTADAIDERLEKLSTEIRDHYGWDALCNPTHLSSWAIYTAGRICSDSAHTSASLKANDYSLVLEPCRSVGNGARVKLDLSRLVAKGQGFSLYPGQVVGVKGERQENKSLVVEQIYDLPPLQRVAPKGPVTPFTLLVASGPYTSDSNLDFAGFQSLIAAANRHEPSVLLLTGPFVDTTHPMLASGEYYEMTIEELFRAKISGPLSELDPSKTAVVLVPTVRDALSCFVTLPQPPLDAAGTETERIELRTRNLQLSPNVQCASNPFYITVNGVAISGFTVDVLRQLGSQEIFRAGKAPENATHSFPNDRMSRFCQHVLNSRCFYPLYPPPRIPFSLGDENEPDLEAFKEAVPIDYSRFRPLEFAGASDVMILPSLLAPFVKPIGDSRVVNPGLASRGSFALLEFVGSDLENQIPSSVKPEDKYEILKF